MARAGDLFRPSLGVSTEQRHRSGGLAKEGGNFRGIIGAGVDRAPAFGQAYQHAPHVGAFDQKAVEDIIVAGGRMGHHGSSERWLENMVMQVQCFKPETRDHA